MTLRELRRIIDRLDHDHDDKRVMMTTSHGDYDLDTDSAPVSTPEFVFMFVDKAEEVRK